MWVNFEVCYSKRFNAMHWLQCSLLVTTLCAAQGTGSAVQTEERNNAAEAWTAINPEENKIDFQLTDSAILAPLFTEKPFFDSNFTETGPLNLTEKFNTTDLTTSEDGRVNLKESQKRNVENRTFNDITPFLLFPILPFLFPPREDRAPLSGENNLPDLKNDSKLEKNPGEAKPFIFFDFAFNIRRVPLNNRTERSNDSKLLNDTNLSISEADDSKQNPQNSRRRRNTNTKVNTLGFSDDSPFFPDSEMDEFLSKPNLFFPDLPFHPRPIKKLSRKKRDQKKPDLKSDLKMFLDAFDEAFMRTKKEVERTDPFLNILREAEQSFDDERKEPLDLFNPVSNIQEKPTMKWRIQRNIKRLKNDRYDDLSKTQESPTIIVDKVVKIGEFHMHDDGHDKNKLKKKKKRDGRFSKNIFLGDEIVPNEDSKVISKNIFELKPEENKRKKRHQHVTQSYANVQSKEIRVLPQLNTTVFSVRSNDTIELRNKNRENEPGVTNVSSKSIKYGNLLKVVDSLKGKIKAELQNSEALANAEPSAERLEQMSSAYFGKTKKRSYDDLKKNVTDLIDQFLAVVREFDDAQLLEKLEVSERDDTGMFDWTEKETLQNSDTYLLRKDPRARRQKKDADIEKEFVELGKKERQVTDLNYLFLSVTLPTVFVFALVLLVCFFNLQIKGKICTKLFRPRQIFLVEDETPSQFVYKNPTGTKKNSNI